MRNRIRLLLMPCLFGAVAARAQSVSQLHTGYSMYARGLEVAELEAGFGLGPWNYQMQLTYHTTGLVGLLFRGHQLTTVQGAWQGDRPAPLRFWGDGVWRGEARQTLIDYNHGQPVIRSLVPPNDAEREPVPAQLQANTVDTLSALALLIRKVQDTGRCETEARTFDGRRLAVISARTVGDETLEPTSRSIFNGRALRCDFEGRQLAGFMRGIDRDELQRPQHGSAWLAQVVPGSPPVPVQISFDTRWFGPATMYLAKAGAGMPPPPIGD
ncbi:MAG: DUF3108 domain-containing protein [Acetobacteraceae bacterium]|nr:DUF3108 domain-containing protein [Acetobacteraceae bacterium]